MSLVTIPDARNLRCKIEVEGYVKGLEPTQLVNLKNGEIASVANAFLTDGYGNFIRISFWNEDIKKVRNNLKIRITDAVTKNYRGEISLYRGRYGTIDVLEFNPDKILNDMEQFQKQCGDNKTLSQYYTHVQNSKSSIYMGIRKSDYLKIIDLFITIEHARKSQTKQNRAEIEAIHHLHQKVTLSPVMIRQILHLFQINIDISRILRISTQWIEKDYDLEQMRFNHTSGAKFIRENTTPKPIFGYTDADLPQEITVDENFVVRNSDKPLCEADQIEFHRKYRGYIDFYANPWK